MSKSETFEKGNATRREVMGEALADKLEPFPTIGKYLTGILPPRG